jgi:hypothetical protein
MNSKPKLSLEEYFSFLKQYFELFRPKIVRSKMVGDNFKL